MATYYASPTGSNAACTFASPGNCVQGMAILAPGDTLILKNGTYQGANYMLGTFTKNGTAVNRITIQAETDGGVLVDGQGVRIPLDFLDSSYCTITGFNFKNSSSDVMKLRGSTSFPGGYASFMELKRCIGWDAVPDQNRHVMSLANISDVLIEDVAAFGIGRNVLHSFRGKRQTYRRTWSRWSTMPEASGSQGPKVSTLLTYNTNDLIFENCIAEWDQTQAAVPVEPYGNFSAAGGITDFVNYSQAANLRMYGNLAYVLTGQNNTNNNWLFSVFGSDPDRGIGGSTLVNNVAYIQPSSSGHHPFLVSDFIAGVPATTFDRNTSIRGAGGTASSFTGDITVTNHLQQDTVGSYNLYTNSGAGATIRYRYVDGVLTGTDLWPFPMGDRIAAALTASGIYASHNVNAVIQGIFGPFPSGGDIIPPAAPTGLRIS